jgi:hypothetical protein
MLNDELAAYSPCELAEFADAVNALLDAADNATVSYCAIRARIQATLYRAVEKRLKAELRAGRTATVIPFPKVKQ